MLLLSTIPILSKHKFIIIGLNLLIFFYYRSEKHKNTISLKFINLLTFTVPKNVYGQKQITVSGKNIFWGHIS